MNTLDATWRSYADKVLPRDGPPVQRTECRRAFYAGAQALFGIVSGPVADATEDAGVMMLEGLRQELQGFKARVLGREAGF